MEADASAPEEWGKKVENLVSSTLFATANSWYVGTNVPGKKRAILCYIGGLPAYLEECARSFENDYHGFNTVLETASA